MTRMPALACAAGLVAGLVLVASPASADVPNGQDALARSAGVMLAPADVPLSMRVGSQYGFSALEGIASTPDLCMRNARLVSGSPTPTSYSAGVDGGERSKRRVAQDVYEYGSLAAAAAAWNTLVRGAEKCSGTVTETVDGRTTTQALTTGRTGATIVGQTGVWVLADVSGDTSRSDTDRYTTYFVVGSTIQATTWISRARLKVDSGRRAFIQGLAVTLASRWLASAPASG